MATKTANVLARVEPDVKEQAEKVMAELGVPASVVINMLYKQIILTKSIPFSLSVPPQRPACRDEMTSEEFDRMMEIGFAQAKADESRPAGEVFEELKQGLGKWKKNTQ